MATLNFPRRAMRPEPRLDDMPANCSWCQKPVGRGVVFTRGKDLGKEAVVCPACLTPPLLGQRLIEIEGAE